jgi:hypothetical protein
MNRFNSMSVKCSAALLTTIFILCLCPSVAGHDIITTKLTWDGEISRIVYAHCANCHHQGGSAFSLMSYQEARPWAKAIEQEVFERRMPPWGAVKGFGEFRNDQALTQEQLELIANWVDGGAPEGNPNDLPAPPRIPVVPAVAHRAGEIIIVGDYKVEVPFKLDGLWPQAIPEAASFQMTVEFPDGRVVPLAWLRGYKTQFGHLFLLQNPLDLPRGAVIHGLPAGSSVILLPAIEHYKTVKAH